jgi:hypothetical protein
MGRSWWVVGVGESARRQEPCCTACARVCVFCMSGMSSVAACGERLLCHPELPAQLRLHAAKNRSQDNGSTTVAAAGGGAGEGATCWREQRGSTRARLASLTCCRGGIQPPVLQVLLARQPLPRLFC